MNLTPLSAGSLLALATLCVANAQSPPLGTFSLATTYDDGVRTTATAIRLRADGVGRVKVDRTARFSHTPDGEVFRWRGEGIWVASNVVRVEYRIARSGGFTSALAPDDYRVLALYRVEGDRIREALLNRTPIDAQAGWLRATSRGSRDGRDVLAARAKAGALVDAVMNYRSDVADYYEPGDEDYYRRDLREAGFYFERALWVEVPALPGFPAATTLRAYNVDPTQVLGEGAG
ncbi:MAG: hypothetical protein KDD82_11155 [Planctomycetes bacterium]|nr:hypothetical protein [Planctomycetota bacterium]